jgi:hypothetical protein
LGGFFPARGGLLAKARFFWALLGTLLVFIFFHTVRHHHALWQPILLFLGGDTAALGYFIWLWALRQEKSRGSQLVIAMPT